MTIIRITMQNAALGIVIGAFSFALPASSQQTPPTSSQTQPAPMQPGPGMGAQMRQQGMEHGRMGQGTGSNMQMPGTGMQSQMPGPGMQQGQMPGAMGSMMGPNMGPQMMQMMMQGHMADLPADHIEGRIAYLHAELKITEAQMPAWTEFANVLRANAKRMAEAQKAQPQAATTTAADRLDDQERWLTARVESVRALKPAYAKLYAALDDKQKKIADELLTPHMGIAMRMGTQ